MKILHLPNGVGGHAHGLSRAERSLGHQSDVLVTSPNNFGYQADIIINSNILENTNRLNNVINKYFKELKKILYFFHIRKKYDVFHFNFGTSLLSYSLPSLYLLELPYYAKNAKIIVTYNGCDARQKYATMKRTNYSACANKNCYGGACNNSKVEQARARKIEIFDEYADTIYAVNPDLLYFLPKRAKFMPYTITRWDEIKPIEYKQNKKLKILHAPTDKACKGSQYIIEALQILNIKYAGRAELILIENLPHCEALELYKQADLVIDQLLIGFYGGFTVEVMKMGKPVIVYINETDIKFMPSKMQQDCLNTVINANIYNIIDKLAEILENPQMLYHYSIKSLEYVNKWHNPIQIAKDVITDYQK